MLYLSQDYFDHLMVTMAHHSTAIEGNTLTQGETKSILIDGYIPKAMDMRELNEVLNYKTYMPQMISSLVAKEEITIKFIQEIHRTLCHDAIQSVPGKFKVVANMIVGANFKPTPPYMVLSELENWRKNLQYQIEKAKTNKSIVEAICRQHIKFEKIHPFPDGNGRTGRALMVYSCIKAQIPPIVIPVEEKKRYINYLNTEDVKGFINFSIDLQKKELEIINAFANKTDRKFPIHDISKKEKINKPNTLSR